jgi:hypothetical protein
LAAGARKRHAFTLAKQSSIVGGGVARAQSGSVHESSENQRSEHPVIYATIATVVGGLIVAGILALLHRPQASPAGPPPPTKTPHQTLTPLPSRPPIAPGQELSSERVSISTGNNLQYQTGAGNENVFAYNYPLGYLSAGLDVPLSVLNAPAPVLNAAYQDCQDSSNRTYEIALDSLAQGDTLCAFIPNGEIVWVQLLGTMTNQDSSDPVLQVEATTFQGPDS